MPQPAEVDARTQQLLDVFRTAQADIDDQLARLLDDPRNLTRRSRLIEIRATVEREMARIETATADWLAGNYPSIYELGAKQGAQSTPNPFAWSQVHVQAVNQLATTVFTQVLEATEFVSKEVKAWIREEGRRQTALSLVEGRTAQQAGRELVRRASAGEVVDLLGGPIGRVRYADGSYRTLADYADTLLRTETATAFNAGTLNQLDEYGCKFVECFDGVGCGATSHNDGDKANGTIRTIEWAAQHPLSHPRCRRSFGGRPDITSLKGAKTAEPTTTAEQRADQRQAEIDRELRLSKARERRKAREARTPREPRAERTPRTPRAADPGPVTVRTPGPEDILSRFKIPDNPEMQ